MSKKKLDTGIYVANGVTVHSSSMCDINGGMDHQLVISSSCGRAVIQGRDVNSFADAVNKIRNEINFFRKSQMESQLGDMD